MRVDVSRYVLIMCQSPRHFPKMYDLAGECLDDGRGQLRLLTRMLRRAEMHGGGHAGSPEWKRYRREVKRLAVKQLGP